MKKQALAIVSDPSGNYLTTWTVFRFAGFEKQLYGGLGECVLETSFAFDYGGADIALGNNIEIRISDADTAASATGDPRIIYRGYVSLIERDVDGPAEGIKVHLLGDYTRLALDVLKSGTQTTLYSNASSGLVTASASQSAADIGLMVRTVIDRYRLESASPRVSYASGGVPNTGTTATYTFQQKTYREALDKLLQMSPPGTYYYINELGLLTFNTPATAPVHKFVFGRHFSKLHIEQSLEAVRNFLLVWNGKTGADSVYKHYQDDRSVGLYGRRTQVQNDYGAADADGADLNGVRFLSRYKNPDLQVQCTIFDNTSNDFGYDIESINPGDTCSFYGFDASSGILFQDNMIITSVRYTLDSAAITVRFASNSIFDVQSDQGQKISDLGSGGLNIPETYT